MTDSRPPALEPRALSVIGLGKLGACLTAVAADSGFTVIGCDVDERTVECVSNLRPSVREPGLRDLLERNGERIEATTDTASAIERTDISFVVVPTPSGENGAFSLAALERVMRDIGAGLSRKRNYHVVAVTSTVLPGTTRQALLPVLEEYSGRRCGPDFGLCYNPAFIALGTVIRDFRKPDLVLVGESDERAGLALERCWAQIAQADTAVRRMNLESAELTKIALNTYVTTKISFANFLAEACQRIPGADVDSVSSALGDDRRIGQAYLTGGLGYGGPCFPRDNKALAYLLSALGLPAPLASATDEYNRTLSRRIAEFCLRWVKPGMPVAVLGLAYKPGTDSLEESQSVELVHALGEGGAAVRAFDPMVGEGIGDHLDESVEVYSTLEECVEGTPVVIITTPDPAFRKIGATTFGDRAEPVTVIDLWRLLRAELSNTPNVNYVPYGYGPKEPGDAKALEALWGGPTRDTVEEA